MNKKRRAIYDKSGGLCWYCGTVLPEKGWHADHFFPIRRNPHSKLPDIPEYDVEMNKVPACASCNNMKHAGSIELFRSSIENFIDSLNKYNTQYKIAKRYGLVEEKRQPVVFWYEKHIPGYAKILYKRLHKGEGDVV